MNANRFWDIGPLFPGLLAAIFQLTVSYCISVNTMFFLLRMLHTYIVMKGAPAPGRGLKHRLSEGRPTPRGNARLHPIVQAPPGVPVSHGTWSSSLFAFLVSQLLQGFHHVADRVALVDRRALVRTRISGGIRKEKVSPGSPIMRSVQSQL